MSRQGFTNQSLLTTKLYRPPATPDLEYRVRLIERLERNRQRPLTLISAPAGYGKTMLASMWLESSGCPVGWVSLDETDNDLVLFTSYLLAAVRKVFPEISLNTQDLIDASNLPTVSNLARHLINDLYQIDESYILVIDDIHQIHNQSIFDLLDELLRFPSPSLHLVLIGRHDPPINIISMRAHGKVTEIREQELRFTPQETAGVLSQLLNRQIDEAVAAHWSRMTEGWVTAIRLAGLSLRQRGYQDDLRVSIQGDNRYLSEYLLAEVLTQLPNTSQTWILKTAILDRFCAPLIEDVCQTEAEPDPLTGKNFIEWLRRDNLFLVPLDDRGEWFRFHHLFQQNLLIMLQSQLSTDELQALYRRACFWHVDNKLLDEALQYALAAGDVQAAVHLIEQHRYELMNSEQWNRLDRWLKLLPSETLTQYPLLNTTLAYLGLQTGQDMQLLNALERGEQQLADLLPNSDAYQIVHSELAGVQAIVDFAFGKSASVIPLADDCLEGLPEQAFHIRTIAVMAKTLGLQMQGNINEAAIEIRKAQESFTWSEKLRARLLHYLCIVYFLEGDLTKVIDTARLGLKITEKISIPETKSWLRYDLGVAYYLRNEITLAEPLLQALVADWATSAPSYTYFGGITLALIYLAQGNPAEASKVLGHLIENLSGSEDWITLAFTDALRVELALRQGNLAEAHRINENIDYEIRPPLWFFYVPQLTPLKLLLAEGTSRSLKEAYARLSVLDREMDRLNRKNVRIEVLALLALVCTSQGKVTSAYEHLQAALALGEIGGTIRRFVDLGAPMEDLLLHYRNNYPERNYTEYINQILAAFPKEKLGFQAFEPEANREEILTKQLEIRSLTRRERQILQLLAEDLSTHEIATKLVISPSTLHVHTKNIYRKLDVHKRTEAADLARVMGLV